MPHDALAEQIRAEFVTQRQGEPGDNALTRDGVGERLNALIRRRAPLLPAADATDLRERLVAEIWGLGVLDPLLADPDISEVMVNGPNQVWIERHGALQQLPMEISATEIARCIERIISPLGLRVDRTSPYVDARLPDGSRINAVVAPLAVDGPYLTIRRFRGEPLRLADFAPPRVERALRRAARGGRSILVSGATGSGKTSLLNALAVEIPGATRLITIEDTAELRVMRPHVVRLEARPATVEGLGAVTVRDLVRNALRMRPDRIIVGEVRGDEALDMVQAMSTGHRGSMSTIHANGPDEALRRLEVMVLMAGVSLPLVALRQLIGSAVDLVVHVERGSGGERTVTQICQVEHERGSLRAVALGGASFRQQPRHGAVVKVRSHMRAAAA